MVEYVDVKPSREKATKLKESTTVMTIDHDSRGYPKVQFVLPLDYFAESTGSTKGIYKPKCMRPLDENLNVGHLKCVKGVYVKKTVQVKHLDQVCYRDPRSEAVKSKESLQLSNCKTSEFILFSFNPVLRVDTEAR